MINVSGLTKYYGDFLAVDNISFSIREGEITGLLGPNGAGKTTTLRMLTCYLNPTSGRINIGDYLVDENPLEVKKLIGYLPETAPLYSEMVVYDYLQFVGEIRSIVDQTRIKEIANLCGLNDVMHKNIGALSKGYKQRVGLAHAMIHDPEILILDEPTSGLDPNQIIEIRNLIKRIGQKKTVILSTHILSEVEATCDRVIIIDSGHIVADARTSELKSGVGKDVKLSIKVSGVNFNTLSEEVKKIDGINSIKEKHDEEGLTSATVISSSDKDARADIFKLISERGWILFEMLKEHRTLENVFRELTRGGDNE
ncbi:MAG: ATP-binding cassette domain-containing protein [Spirochaetota bacterium]|nr:ATP-binding cassette domain-containing protein [Spirochaetota bacterium]